MEEKLDPLFIEALKGVSWYTADHSRPYLVKASVSEDQGYVLLITDLESTYFCAGDKDKLIAEKIVSYISCC